MSHTVLSSASFNDQLLEFLLASPTAYHATASLLERLLQAGFERLHEGAAWQLQPGSRYVLTRNDSSLIAFIYGTDQLVDHGIRMVGAHTDSPCLKVKPKPELVRAGYAQLGVEVYGGALLAPWFDRDLSMAGKVSFRNSAGVLQHALIDFKKPVVSIPSLAIHLDRGVNDNRSINAQRDIVPLWQQLPTGEEQVPVFREQLLVQLNGQYPEADAVEVLDYEISLYDTQPPAVIGQQSQFIASARLDNLLSCFTGLQALLQADNRASTLLICTDHEEVGSASCCGAKGPLLQNFLERLLPDSETRVRVIERSMMISADNAHGIHPNFMDRHDENHGPLLNRGPVIKINANQRYASSSDGSALFRLLCREAGVPVQNFVARTDMGCGSTIGPVIAAEVGVRTLDVGVPTFAMHSIRELAGTLDAWYLYQVLTGFYGYRNALTSQLLQG